MIAISVRQPWAWLIVNGYKDIENRDWQTTRKGNVLIHASKKMTRLEYQTCVDFVAKIDPEIVIPSMDELERGGIVGKTTIVDCVDQSDSPWFLGEYGFVLKGSAPLQFFPCPGQLGFFNVEVM